MDALDGFKSGLNLHQSERHYGYLCLCQDWKQTPMWSHYADQHQGIALGFSFAPESTKSITHLERKKVFYDSEAFQKAILNLSDSFQIMRAYPVGSPGLMAGEAQQFKLDFMNDWMHFYEVARFMKSECWSYEKEIRYEAELPDNLSPGISIKFSPDDLKHVIFGIRCSTDDINSIRDDLNGPDWSHVKYWKAYPDPVALVVKAKQL